VYYCYRKRKNNGFIEEVDELLRERVREQRSSQVSPSFGLIDSFSVKISRNGGDKQGIDGDKKPKAGNSISLPISLGSFSRRSFMQQTFMTVKGLRR
jgi:hypothetical protein